MVSTSNPSEPPAGRTWRTYFPQGDLWVFGYGSLIWKPPPHYDQRIPGYIDGYVRRFWQASTDHRGTPEVPGRVVTVIEREFWETLDDPQAHLESASGKVWGAAYHIPASHAEEVHDYLDIREIDGYTVHYTPFHPISAVPASAATTTTTTQAGGSSSSPITCMVYIGRPSNPQFLRDPARREPQDVAQVISRGHGQSGKNTEYLYLLEKALEGIGLGSADVHVTELVRRVEAIERERAVVEEAEAEQEVKKYLAEASRDAHAGFFRDD
ncbi:hypothetical protein ASPZODRAFT_130702 [Penicilliopsis zonata CBS 506.65]|uniref:glutathione-specific gamma-glutamylcyclotransferase n=1 Tax=Penicilliopsis zonata CBS 506.65 TaxID=1073090 RepID=A0A1L9SMW8_9EURO|nr:hypothetical protein ASPZODRAFT_130702 [Penicilliopsis zonata CBS 506.65]OJJ48612.1 hypothetical protein ASPZODRAFT_130702 [Penicilliopsis zonata CBS 506.65]